MKRILFLLAILPFGFAVAQHDIHFKDINWEQAKTEAEAQNKLIFLDASTSWCAPCRWMEKNVFVQPEVANYFNSHFINVKIDCEKGEGVQLAKTYGVRSFPTYMFINYKGELIYRTQSKMEVDAFLKQGQRANNPIYQIPSLQTAFDKGERNSTFLLRYILVMNNVDTKATNKAKKALDSLASDNFLKSPDGWEIIKMMARNHQDKYGAFFQTHQAYFKGIAKPEEYQAKYAQLLSYDMYQYINSKNKKAFEKGLVYFENNSNEQFKIDAAMYRAEWAGNNESAKNFKRVTNKLRKGILRNNDEKLSFIARRFSSKFYDNYNEDKVKQCYILAKQAVVLNAESYSNQGTFSEICILLHKKKEAVVAALKARELAEAETSKIQKLADKLVAKAKALK